MSIFIVTINYNSSENTIKLLESLKNQIDKDFGIIVVDNNSNDVDKLMNYETTETNIIYIKNDRNLGFSGGNNMGIRRALENGSDWVLLLNNDTMPESRLIEHIKAKIDPSTGSGRGGKEGIIGLALDEGEKTAFGGLIQWLKPTLKHVYNPANLDKNSYTIGGAMLIHKSVFEKIGFLDENYFLYFEDADFTLRAKRAGVSISFLSKIKISHSVSASTKKLCSPTILKYHYRNALYFNLKNGPWYIKLLVWPWSCLIALKQIIKIIIGKNREQSLAILKGVGDWHAGKMGKLHV